jgi:hypothetical protein
MICLSQSKCFQIAINWGCDPAPNRSGNIETNQNIIKDGVLSVTSFWVARDLMPQANRNSIEFCNLRRRRGAGPRVGQGVTIVDVLVVSKH